MDARVRIWTPLLALGFALLAGASAAQAQPIGSFTWQLQPYCNRVTLTVVQQGGLYLLAGTDNLCGAGTATVNGTAVPAGAGVALGFTIALPSGRAAHVSATLSLSTVSGTWTDGDGNSGPFAFGANTNGAPRPAPAGATAITVNQFDTTVYAGTGAAATVARSDHLHDDRYYTQAQSTAAFVPKTALGPRGLIAQAEVFQSTATFRSARASNGQTITASRPWAGTTQVTFPGFALPPGASFDQNVQVTAADFNTLCAAVSRSSNGTNLSVQVNCINPSTLAAVDSVFFILVIS